MPRKLFLLLAAFAAACGGKDNRCQPLQYEWRALIPGPAETGYDSALEQIARRRDRQMHVFHTPPTGVNAEISIDRSRVEERALIEDFLAGENGYDFEAYSGRTVADVVDSWWKVAGMYGGAGLAADAFRYGVLRDQCYSQEEIEPALDHLLQGLESFHLAVVITGGTTIARGFANKDFPGGSDVETTPLLDGQGNPLPAEKNNGTWREDNSGGLYPNFVWEDSCSRDMLIGWMVGLGAAWEVLRDDPGLPPTLREKLQHDALAVGENLRTVRESGYDLELLDADGRTTYHGYLNENNLDRTYIDGVRNGFYALMALGIVAVLVEVSGDPGLRRYLYQELIAERDLPAIAAAQTLELNLDKVTNFSNYNMAFDGAWLALRHIDDPDARASLRESLEKELYDTPGASFQPVEQKQSFFDLVYAAGMCDAAAGRACTAAPDQQAIARALETLREFPEPPFWEFGRANCDEAEIQSGHCIADDGSELTVLGYVGRNGDLICAEPLPMSTRPSSNYYWRSNPYRPNDGAEGPGMFAGPDFSLAYWLGRWVRAADSR